MLADASKAQNPPATKTAKPDSSASSSCTKTNSGSESNAAGNGVEKTVCAEADAPARCEAGPSVQDDRDEDHAPDDDEFVEVDEYADDEDEEDDEDYVDAQDEEDDEEDDDDDVQMVAPPGLVYALFRGRIQASAPKTPTVRGHRFVEGELRTAFAPSSQSLTGSLARLPIELLLRILSNLDPHNLNTVSTVSSLFYTLANDEAIWRVHCLADWHGRRHCHRSGRLHPFFAYKSLLHKLSIDECIGLLQDRGETVTPKPELATSSDADASAINDGDADAGDESTIAYRDSLREAVDKTTPVDGVFAISPSKWKASYYTARIDSRRTNITEHELASVDWYYIDSWGSHYGYQDDDDEDVEEDDVVKDKNYPIVRFDREHHTRGPISGFRPRTSPWRVENGHLQVAQYPLHTISRTDDWGWTISNTWVVYQSI